MESRLTLLGLLSAGPGHGYDLKRSWDHWFAASKPLAYGQVYATLARLVRDGLITQIETEPGAGPERKRYEVTDAGRQSVEQWLLTPVTPAGDVQADIFAKTVIALMLDDDAGRLLDLQRAEHMARMRELTRLKQDGDLRTVLLADHALFHIEADLRWMETTAARLGELGLSEHLDKRPTQLSGGQAQRAAVARALLTGPRILFADEPTGSLDSLAAERTMEVLLASVRSRGASLVIITHDARVAAYADREVTVRDGRIGPGATHAVVGPKEPGHAATGGRS